MISKLVIVKNRPNLYFERIKMTDVSPSSCTAVTIRFQGKNHKNAAETYMIQFTDGGMYEDIEDRLKTHGHIISDSDFSLEKNEIVIILGDEPA